MSTHLRHRLIRALGTVLVVAGLVTSVGLADPAPAQAQDSFSCVALLQGDTATVSFSGHRAYSENLLVDGRWVATTTGLDSYTVDPDVVDGVTNDYVVRLRGRGYTGPNGYEAVRCRLANSGNYTCVVAENDGIATLEFGGDRAYSENLLVDGAWRATVTGRSEFRTAAGQTYELRLRGYGWAGPGGFHTHRCDPATPPRALAPLEPASGVLFGAYPANNSSYYTAGVAAVESFESLTDSKLDIVQIFHPPHQPELRVDLANRYLEEGRIPLLTWKVGPHDWPSAGDMIADRVVAGEFDDQIRARAAEANRIQGPFFSRLFHEPDGSYGRDYDLNSSNIRAYWQRVRDIFDAEGVTNAVWVWNAASLAYEEFDIYPGDDLVDWIGADPYLWIDDQVSPQCRSALSAPYQPLYDRLGGAFWEFAAAHPDKPIMIGEWGSGHRQGQDLRARFIASAADAITAEPRLKAIVYFNTDAGCDWRLDAGPVEAIDAYTALVNDPAHHVDVDALIAGFAG